MKLLQQTRRSQEDLSKQDRVLVRKIKQDDNIYQNKLTDWVKQRASKLNTKQSNILHPVLKTSSQLLDELSNEKPYVWANFNATKTPIWLDQQQKVTYNQSSIYQHDLGPPKTTLNSSALYEKLAEPDTVRRAKKNLFGSSPSTDSHNNLSKQNQLTSNKLANKAKTSEREYTDESCGNSPVFGVEPVFQVEAEKKKSPNIRGMSNEYIHSGSENVLR